METEHQYVLFTSGNQQFALPLQTVERVLQIVQIKPLSKVPDFILGVIILEGDPIPVCNLRKIFVLPEKEFDLSDQLVVVSTRFGRVALWVDAVLETLAVDENDISRPGKLFLDVSYINGVVNLNDNVVMISDPDSFLDKEQMEVLRRAIETSKEEKKKLSGRKTRSDKTSSLPAV
jgi:purine-binding chemotaxis protein CheW